VAATGETGILIGCTALFERMIESSLAAQKKRQKDIAKLPDNHNRISAHMLLFLQVGRRGLLAIPGYRGGRIETVIQKPKKPPKSLKTIGKINMRQL
jgi:hypothetical protein